MTYVKEFWAHYNAQIIDQTKLFSKQRLNRMSTQIERFINITQENMQLQSKLWENVRRKEILGQQDISVPLNINFRDKKSNTSLWQTPSANFDTQQVNAIEQEVVIINEGNNQLIQKPESPKKAILAPQNPTKPQVVLPTAPIVTAPIVTATVVTAPVVTAPINLGQSQKDIFKDSSSEEDDEGLVS